MRPNELVDLVRQAVADALRENAVPEVMDTRACAGYLGVSRQRLEIWRSHGGGPPYSKVGRLVRYEKSVVDKWLADHRRGRTE